jgi:hypothetical protein
MKHEISVNTCVFCSSATCVCRDAWHCDILVQVGVGEPKAIRRLDNMYCFSNKTILGPLNAIEFFGANDESCKPMTKIARSLVLLALCALILSGCISVWTANFRLTVSVDDNGTVHTGTGVWRSRVIKMWSSKFYGQAIPVDMGPKGTLFVLITNQDGFELSDYAVTLFKTDDLKIGDTRIITCPDTRCPRMVRFTNERDPATVQAVDPTNLSASFGPGVSLRPITVTIVRNGPTKGLIKRLPWLKIGSGTSASLVELDMKKAPGTDVFATTVNIYDFSQGVN